MKPHPKIRKITKWAGAVVSVVLVVVWVGSAWWQVSWGSAYHKQIAMSYGGLRLDIDPSRLRNERLAIEAMQGRLDLLCRTQLYFDAHGPAPASLLRCARDECNDLHEEIDAMKCRFAVREMPRYLLGQTLRHPNYHTELWSGQSATAPGSAATPVSVTVPIWFIAVVTVAPSAFIWRRDVLIKRRARVNYCPACNYNRHGLPAGAVCPECGGAAVAGSVSPSSQSDSLSAPSQTPGVV